MERTVENEWGVVIDFDVAVGLMDDDIREWLHGELAPCTDQVFFVERPSRNGASFNVKCQ